MPKLGATPKACAVPTLSATQRLQFHRGFTLDDALALVPYFARLGISHIYASPLLTARSGSTHGYDVVDPTRINPELGGEPALRRLVAALRQHGMGLIVDFVPNHMAVGGADNPWWLDVLAWGRNSPYAQYFDIQWQSQDPLMNAQLLVPFLRTDYGEALSNGSIELRFDAEVGVLHAQHFEHRFPLAPHTYGAVLAFAKPAELAALGQHFSALQQDRSDEQRKAQDTARALRAELAGLARNAALRTAIDDAIADFIASDPMALHELLERQHYRLASWRTAADDINWRRFFDINELGGLRVENPRVFEALHDRIFALIGEGLIDGLRIDHVDGLANPRAYCRKLRRRIDRLLATRPPHAACNHFPIYVEKILGDDETLARDWQVDGTTGYEFMNQVSLLQHDASGEQPLQQLWQEISGRSPHFTDEVREARQLVLTTSLAGDLENVAQGLLLIARADIATRDFTLGTIRRALMALIAHFPVYRTYAVSCGRSDTDAAVFASALEGARNTLGEQDWPVLAKLDDWLGGMALHALPPTGVRYLLRKVLARFQQLTSPAAAKAVEDTACYRSGVLLSRYDVGFDAARFAQSTDAFHHQCQQRAQRFPANLLTTATHDHKRGEDCRARLAVLSERPQWFADRLHQWAQLSPALKTRLDGNLVPTSADEMLLYQTLLASWPLDLDSEDHANLVPYRERIQRWQQKALREAKLHSSWSAPNVAYENACDDFVRRLLEAEPGAVLRREIAAAATAISPAGALNSFAQTLLRLSTPGVPDLYQGNEFWDFSLVDPDNRQPVDFCARRSALAAHAAPQELLKRWRDGHIKQWLIAELLALRAANTALFTVGEYLPLPAEGEAASHVLAFARHLDGHWLIVVLPRLTVPLLGARALPQVPPDRWGATRIVLPPPIAGVELRGLCGNRFGAAETPASLPAPESPSQSCAPAGGLLMLTDVLASVPVNVLHSFPAMHSFEESVS